MLIIFNVSSANSAGAAASASSGFAKKPKAVVHALKSKAFLRVDTASFSTSSFDEEEEAQISRSLIAEEEDTFFLVIIIFIIPFLLAFVAKAFRSREKPPDDFDDAPRREERDARDDGIVKVAEKEAELFIVFRLRRGEEKKWINWKKIN
jgi:hypothetical protein